MSLFDGDRLDIFGGRSHYWEEPTPAPVQQSTKATKVAADRTTKLASQWLKEGQRTTHNGQTKAAPREGWYDCWINHRGRFCIAISSTYLVQQKKKKSAAAA